MTQPDFDDIIVGAGSSGAVLAARLSEDRTRKVLLLEAGPDYATLSATPSDILGPDVSLRAHDWRMRSLTLATGKRYAFPRGRVVGGSSAVNGAVALRGDPADYEEWVKLGNSEWTWDNVLPYFKKLEDDDLGPSELHGRGGPIPVRRTRPEHFCATQAAAHESFKSLGFAEVTDHNEPSSTGVGPIPLNVRDNIRISTAIGYLQPARGRENLTIRGEALVKRVIVQNGRAQAIECSIAGVAHTLTARRITLSAGAIHSPGILMRSGIGPRSEVEQLGLSSVRDLAGVGAQLFDHPAAGIHAVPRAGAQGDNDPNHQTIVRYTAEGSDLFNDMQLFLFGRVPLKGTALEQSVGAERTFLAVASLVKPRSVGRLRVTTADPSVAPSIELDFHSHPDDLRRMVQGFRLCWAALNAQPMAARIERIAHWSEDAFKRSDDELGQTVRHLLGTSYHPAGTARMGRRDDPGAVVDQYCRVHGIENLRVVDASVMPTLMRANTNFPCMMLGERVADWMRAE